MNKSKEITRTLIAAVIAIIIAASSAAIMGTVRAGAATVKGSAQPKISQKAQANKLPASTSKINQFAKAYTFKALGKTSYGYDWSYKADRNNLKVTCKYDFKAHKYNFTITGKSYGLNHITIKYKTSDKKWASQKMTIFVDSQKYIMRTA